MRTLSLFGFLAITLPLAGCGDADPTTPATTSTGIEIEGTWSSDFGTDVITDDAWSSDFGTGPSVSTITDYSNEENVAVTRNADDADFDPGKYNRIVWTEVAGNAFFHCTTDFGLETEEEALAADTVSDATDPAASGCGASSFPWTKLTRP
jgi:hypothetical protein